MDIEDSAGAAATPALTRAHYSRLRFYWVNRGNASNQGTALDLDLFAHGYIEYTAPGSGKYRCTEKGAHALAAESERERQRRAPHHELGGRLAQWLQERGRMTWEGVEFLVRQNDVYALAKAYDIDVTNAYGVLYAAPRPDVFSLVPTHNAERLNPTVHEVKVSRADFLADVAKPMKRLAYACMAEAVYYAAPEGIISPDEVPKNCGLVVERKVGEFKILKRARRQRVTFTPSNFMNLVMKPGKVLKPLLT